MDIKPYSLSAKVVIHDEAGRCLVLKRSLASKGNPGKWDFPGGKVEEGENFDAGLLREVEEETGLSIALHRVIGAAEFVLTERKVAYIILEGLYVAGEVRLSSEHIDYKWVARRDLAGVELAGQFTNFAAAYSQSA